MISAPLPPRPQTVITSDEDLPDHTISEQKIGRQNVQAANKRLEEEQEAGRQLVEKYKHRVAIKAAELAAQLTIDSEQ